MPAAIQPGELGTINLKKDGNGVWRARARYRDLSGRVRWLRGEGATRKEAARDIRGRFSPNQGTGNGLTKHSTVAEMATAWLAHKRATKLDSVKEQSYRQYESTLRNHILPRFENARLSEMTVSRMSDMLKQVRLFSHARSRGAL